MGGNGGCGCGAVGPEPCRCERPATPPPNGALAPVPPPRSPVSAPGLRGPYTRFDLFEEARRRGMPVAFPADPARPPPLPGRPEAERLRALTEAGPTVLEPPPHPLADGRRVVTPTFDAPRPRTAADGPVAPEGAPLDIERFFDVASPEGVAVPFEMAWPGDMPVRQTPQLGAARAGEPRPEPALATARSPATREDALEPPEYLSSIGGAPERRLLEAPPPEDTAPSERPQPPDPPGFASPQAPHGNEPRAPGQAACTQDAYYVFPPVEQFLFTPQPPEARGGGGGGEEEPKRELVLPGPWVDPCPCVCTCVHFSVIVNLFVEARKLLGSFFHLFGRDTTSVLGLSGQPAVVIATPDGFVEQVRDLLVRRDAVRYGTPASSAPGSAALADGLSATFAARARAAPASAPRLLWPELDGTLASVTRVVAPVGPGPGLPGIGSHPLVPASGATLRAAPGSLPAGIAPAGDGFGPGLRGRAAP